VGPINLVLWVGGAILLWLGYARARGPWARYQDLKAQDANVARYEAWRGGIREDSGPTGASVAMAILRRQVQVGAGLGIAGLIAIVAGFAIR
jgi:threonine/homoserine/homoserine lactone efflux protein